MSTGEGFTPTEHEAVCEALEKLLRGVVRYRAAIFDAYPDGSEGTEDAVRALSRTKSALEDALEALGEGRPV